MKSLIPTWSGMILLFGAYFFIHSVARGLISETLGIDDSQEVVFAQELRWGYGPQPPFYTWLVFCLSKSLGLSSFTLALLKNALLFAIYLLTYFITRQITKSHALGFVAAAALQFMPSVTYEAHRELTHSILASVMVLATLYVLLQIERLSRLNALHERDSRPAWLYVFLGVAGGLGVLSKYNYAIFLVSLLLAMVSIKSWRPIIFNHRGFISLLILLLIIAPNLLWIKTHPEQAFVSTGKFDFDPTHSLKSMVRGIGSWASTTLDQIGLVAVLFALCSWRNIRASRSTRSTTDSANLSQAGIPDNAPVSRYTCLLSRLFAFSAMLILLGIIVSGATNCRNRWLQPLVIPAPILASLLCYRHLKAGHVKAIGWLALLVGAAILIAAPGRILLTERLKKYDGLNSPYRELARQLKAPLEKAPALYCSETMMAANLRVWFPDKPVTSTGTSKLYPPQAPCALVWNPAQARTSEFLSAAVALSGKQITDAIYVEATLKYHHKATMRLGVLMPQ